MAGLKPYSDLPGRATLQVLGDVLCLLWVYAWVRAGRALHDATLSLARPGELLESAGADLASGLASAADTAADVPLVGDRLRAPLDAAGSAAGGVARAGRDQQEAVADLALLLGVVVAVLPLLLAAVVYVWPRLRFARRAAAARGLIDSGADLDLFALRALSGQPFHVLARVSPDPAGAWRRGDPRVVRELAGLELRRAGLRVPDLH